MLTKIPPKYLEALTLRELEELVELKKRNHSLAGLLKERERLRLELYRVESLIADVDRSELERRAADEESSDAVDTQGPSFLGGRRRKNLKDYIAQVLLDARGPMSPTDIQKRLPEVGYVSSSTNPRSFYNTVFQALQRYDIFTKEGRKYRLTVEAEQAGGAKEILPKKKTRLKDFIIEVLSTATSPLKVSEIASRVVIEGYPTDLSMDELCQRVAATLKKYLNKDFDWDSQRYRLAQRN